MTVVALTGCRNALRGDLTKWLLEIDTGVYIGNISARIREELWKKISENIGTGHALMVFSAQNEQGFDFKILNSKRIPTDFDGLNLILMPISEDKAAEIPNTIHEKRILRQRPKVQTRIADYVVMDSETTGLDRTNDRMIELGAVKVLNGEIADMFQRLIHVDRDLSPEIVSLTSITNEELRQNGVSELQAVQAFREFALDMPLVSHNITFDMAFLNNACQRNNLDSFSNQQIDTIKLARKQIKDVQNYSLGTLLKYFAIALTPCHRALPDCMATYELFNKLNKNE